MKTLCLVTAVLLSLYVVIASAGAQLPGPDEDFSESDLSRDYQDIERMQREDDSTAPVDYGYGPGVLPPSNTQQPTAPAPRRGAGAGR